MNLKGLSPKVRALVESVREAAIEEGYDITDIDEDGDAVALTFTKEADLTVSEADDDEDDE